MSSKDKYLTIHGHFYQPPRENPWLESIELQDSALPFHDWNERINFECYNPNSVSRIVDNQARIIDIVNNYSLMSFNFGPTLMSWLEQYAPKTYERVIKADCLSQQERSGHGNAIAQVYNHIIMPLANKKDKYTQIIWGIKDFQYRFGRIPKGMWLAETAIDDEAVEALVDCGIKFTVLSPYQANAVRPLDDSTYQWCDVSWGNVDPGRVYRYFVKNNPQKYIDIFFYDGAISKSVAFDNLLKDGEKFIKRLQDGVSNSRDYNQLVSIGTDGESHGHHTKFGDMALSYILKIKSKQAGFKLTNYGEFLEKEPPKMEVDIKQSSSWSCSHGVGRWKEDCGCSTGALAGWNQKWRKPLREALDWLRDELSITYENEAKKYLKNPWEARNRYIDVVLDRNKHSIDKFIKENTLRVLSADEKINLLKLMEIQRQAMLMYTSCGWFFADISGIETTQILKYAAKAIQLAMEFTDKDLEKPFIKILAEAQSNIKEFGNGKDIYQKFVKPSVVNINHVVSHWAITSLFEEYPDESDVYCYSIKTADYKKLQKGNTALLLGRIELTSKITLEKKDMIFSLLHYSGEDFHCAIKLFSSNSDYNKIKNDLTDKYYTLPLTEVIRALDEHFGKEYYTLKNLFIEERRKIIDILIKDQLEAFALTYKSLYKKGKGPILQMLELGLQIPAEFKIAAEYTLSQSFNNTVIEAEDITDKEVIDEALSIHEEALKIQAKLYRKPAVEKFMELLKTKVRELAYSMEIHQAEYIIEILDIIKQLNLNVNISEPQNIYFNYIYSKVDELIDKMRASASAEDKKFIATILNLGEKLNINIGNSYLELNKILPPKGVNL